MTGTTAITDTTPAGLRALGDGRYAARVYYRDHTERDLEGPLQDGILDLGGDVAFARLYPPPPGGLDTLAFQTARNRALAFERLDSATVAIHLPTFAASAARTIDSLVAAHRAEIASVPNLILDVRGNGGGADRSYRALMPLLYDGSIEVTGVRAWPRPRPSPTGRARRRTRASPRTSGRASASWSTACGPTRAASWTAPAGP